MAHQKQPKKSETAFCLPIINDPGILKEPGVILVSNISDAEARKRLEAAQTLFPSDSLHNKPAGWGLAGGGGDGLESPMEIAEKELGEETGRNKKPGTTPKLLGEPLHRNSRINKNGEIVRMSRFFAGGQKPAVHLNKRELQTTIGEENIVYVFGVDVVWEGTELQSLLRSVKEQLVDGGYSTEEDVQRDGVWVEFKELPPEAVAKLGIETREIAGIGIFPISLFASVNDPNDFPVPASPDYPNFRIYPAHLKYTKDGLRELGLLPPEVKAETPKPEIEATL